MIDFKNNKPVYLEIVDFYAKLIDRGAIAAGEVMPSVRELAVSERINPNTVEKAYTHLVRKGYLKNVPKIGFFVLDRSEALKNQAEIKKRLEAIMADGYKMSEIKACIEQIEGEENDRDNESR